MRIRTAPIVTSSALLATTMAACSYGIGRLSKKVILNDPGVQNALLRLQNNDPDIRNDEDALLRRIKEDFFLERKQYWASRARTILSVPEEYAHLSLPIKKGIGTSLEAYLEAYLAGEIDASLKTFVSPQVQEINGVNLIVVIGFNQHFQEPCVNTNENFPKPGCNLYQKRYIRCFLYRNKGQVIEVMLPVQKVADILGGSVTTNTAIKHIFITEDGKIKIQESFKQLALVRQASHVSDLKNMPWIGYDLLDSNGNDGDLMPGREVKIAINCPP